jgi:hypothetical protein
MRSRYIARGWHRMLTAELLNGDHLHDGYFECGISQYHALSKG